MPDFNRRGFMQLLGAAGLTPLLPSLPTRAATAAASGSVSKALWAGIYGRSGSVPKFVNAARNMGLPNAAIQGVSARSVGVKIAVSAATSSIPRVAGASNTTLPSASTTEPLKAVRKVMRDVERATSTNADTATIADQDAETLRPINMPNSDAP